MSIVDRLKYFMKSADISSSQLADTCGIPRPTVSQILNGRNKKISHDIIDKIHVAYPGLSVNWIMFGEGDMMVNSNFEISKHQNRTIEPQQDAELPDKENIEPQPGQEEVFTNFSSENQTDENSDIKSEYNQILAQAKGSIGLSQQATSKHSQPQQPVQKQRKISYIMVFYDDNSFEKF